MKKYIQYLNERFTPTQIRLFTVAAILVLCVILAVLPGGRRQESELEPEQETDLSSEDSEQHTVIYPVEDDRIIVLDPGHDTVHIGTRSADEVEEETLNLKIANYCKEALEAYPGVEVYLTRTTTECPFGDIGEAECLEDRVAYAADIGADVFVSLHLNSNVDTSFSGTQIYIPNPNYDMTMYTESYELAGHLLAQLTALGLEDNGMYWQDSSEKIYPDGSAADYWSVIYQCKLAGIPAVIVEHAFMSNPADMERYLSTEEGLKSLGEADARAIAEYFGL